MQRPTCCKCGSSGHVLLRSVLNAGGARMIAWRCTACNCWAQQPVAWLKHDLVKASIGRHSIDEIPAVEDYRIVCDICGKPGAQLHHFFPQAFARHDEVSSDWPSWCRYCANLCDYHHNLWHDLVTPWMPGRGNSRQGKRQLNDTANAR